MQEELLGGWAGSSGKIVTRAGERRFPDQLFAVEEEVPELVVGVVRDVQRIVFGEVRMRICRRETERKANVITKISFCLFVAGKWESGGRTVWLLWRRRRRRRRTSGGMAEAGVTRAPPTSEKSRKVLVCSR